MTINSAVYFTSGMSDVIDRYTSVRDLGVILNEDANFTDHIEKVETREKFIREDPSFLGAISRH